MSDRLGKPVSQPPVWTSKPPAPAPVEGVRRRRRSPGARRAGVGIPAWGGADEAGSSKGGDPISADLRQLLPGARAPRRRRDSTNREVRARRDHHQRCQLLLVRKRPGRVGGERASAPRQPPASAQPSPADERTCRVYPELPERSDCSFSAEDSPRRQSSRQ